MLYRQGDQLYSEVIPSCMLSFTLFPLDSVYDLLHFKLYYLSQLVSVQMCHLLQDKPTANQQNSAFKPRTLQQSLP